MVSIMKKAIIVWLILIILIMPVITYGDDLGNICLGIAAEACVQGVLTIIFHEVSRSLYVPRDFTEVEKFFISGTVPEEGITGLRIIEHVEKDQHPDGVSHISFTIKGWQQLFFADNEQSKKVHELLKKSDGEPFPVQLDKDGNLLPVNLDKTGRIIQRPKLFSSPSNRQQDMVNYKTFNLTTFLDFNTRMFTTADKVSVYTRNLISYYSREQGAMYIFLVPGLTLEDFNEIIESEDS